jgi:hypothetical protein
MEAGKLYSIQLHHGNKNFMGIIQGIGKEWIILYQLFTDYMMDGYVLLNKKYIADIRRDDKILFTEEVLKAKGVSFEKSTLNIPLDNTDALFQWLKDNQIVFMFSLRDNHVSYVGEVYNILPKSFYLRVLEVDGHWWERKLLYRKETVRSIDFKSDYIESLLAYNRAKYK